MDSAECGRKGGGVNLELFPCSGGMAEGFRRAGVVFDFAFDVEPIHCDSYEHNLGHRPICMDVRDLVRMLRGGWLPGPVDLLVADPPCTPWSRAGKRRGREDERDMLSWANRVTVLRLAYERLFHSLAEIQRRRELTGPEIDTLDAARQVLDTAEAMERGI